MKHAPVAPEPNPGAAPFSPEGGVDLELDQTRLQFSGLNELQKDLLDPYVEMLMGDELTTTSGQVRPSDYLVSSDDSVLSEFLARHYSYLDMQRADQYLGDVFAFYKSSYIDRLETGIREGWVSADAREMLPVIDAVSLEIGDMRKTRLEWRVGQFTGYNNTVIIAQGIHGDDYQQEVVANIRDTAPHELSHRFSRWLPRWASESFAEQLGLVVQHGEPTVFHADLRSHEKSPFYNAETALMHTLLTGAPKQNPELSLLAIRAFTSASPDSKEWELFNSALDSAWGAKDVFRKVSNCVEGLEKDIAAENTEWSSLQVEPEASKQAMYTLLHNQTRIFGRDYRPPGRHRREPAGSGYRQVGRHRRK